jgi:hypothetical protein
MMFMNYFNLLVVDNHASYDHERIDLQLQM